MRRPSGTGLIVDPSVDRPQWERDSVACGHCGKHVWVKPGTASTVYLILHRDGRWTEEPGAGCHGCMSTVCLPCHADGRCRPLERQLELAEAGRIILGAG